MGDEPEAAESEAELARIRRRFQREGQVEQGLTDSHWLTESKPKRVTHGHKVCKYCLEIIPDGDPVIHCAECDSFNEDVKVILCKKCFAFGCESGQHRRGHNYRVINNLPKPLFKLSERLGHWGYEQDIEFIRKTRMTKAANWEEIAKSFGKPGMGDFLSEYFEKFFIHGYIGQASRNFAALTRLLDDNNTEWWNDLGQATDMFKFQIAVSAWAFEGPQQGDPLKYENVVRLVTRFVERKRLLYESLKIDGRPITTRALILAKDQLPELLRGKSKKRRKPKPPKHFKEKIQWNVYSFLQHYLRMMQMVREEKKNRKKYKEEIEKEKELRRLEHEEEDDEDDDDDEDDEYADDTEDEDEFEHEFEEVEEAEDMKEDEEEILARIEAEKARKREEEKLERKKQEAEELERKLKEEELSKKTRKGRKKKVEFMQVDVKVEPEPVPEPVPAPVPEVKVEEPCVTRRGRKKKVIIDIPVDVPAPRKRGRPRKIKIEDVEVKPKIPPPVTPPKPSTSRRMSVASANTAAKEQIPKIELKEPKIEKNTKPKKKKKKSKKKLKKLKKLKRKQQHQLELYGTPHFLDALEILMHEEQEQTHPDEWGWREPRSVDLTSRCECPDIISSPLCFCLKCGWPKKGDPTMYRRFWHIVERPAEFLIFNATAGSPMIFNVFHKFEFDYLFILETTFFKDIAPICGVDPSKLEMIAINLNTEESEDEDEEQAEGSENKKEGTENKKESSENKNSEDTKPSILQSDAPGPNKKVKHSTKSKPTLKDSEPEKEKTSDLIQNQGPTKNAVGRKKSSELLTPKPMRPSPPIDVPRTRRRSVVTSEAAQLENINQEPSTSAIIEPKIEPMSAIPKRDPDEPVARVELRPVEYEAPAPIPDLSESTMRLRPGAIRRMHAQRHNTLMIVPDDPHPSLTPSYTFVSNMAATMEPPDEDRFMHPMNNPDIKIEVVDDDIITPAQVYAAHSMDYFNNPPANGEETSLSDDLEALNIESEEAGLAAILGRMSNREAPFQTLLGSLNEIEPNEPAGLRTRRIRRRFKGEKMSLYCRYHERRHQQELSDPAFLLSHTYEEAFIKAKFAAPKNSRTRTGTRHKLNGSHLQQSESNENKGKKKKTPSSSKAAKDEPDTSSGPEPEAIYQEEKLRSRKKTILDDWEYVLDVNSSQPIDTEPEDIKLTPMQKERSGKFPDFNRVDKRCFMDENLPFTVQSPSRQKHLRLLKHIDAVAPLWSSTPVAEAFRTLDLDESYEENLESMLTKIDIMHGLTKQTEKNLDYLEDHSLPAPFPGRQILWHLSSDVSAALKMIGKMELKYCVRDERPCMPRMAMLLGTAIRYDIRRKPAPEKLRLGDFCEDVTIGPAKPRPPIHNDKKTHVIRARLPKASPQQPLVRWDFETTRTRVQPEIDQKLIRKISTFFEPFPDENGLELLIPYLNQPKPIIQREKEAQKYKVINRVIAYQIKAPNGDNIIAPLVPPTNEKIDFNAVIKSPIRKQRALGLTVNTDDDESDAPETKSRKTSDGKKVKKPAEPAAAAAESDDDVDHVQIIAEKTRDLIASAYRAKYTERTGAPLPKAIEAMINEINVKRPVNKQPESDYETCESVSDPDAPSTSATCFKKTPKKRKKKALTKSERRIEQIRRKQEKAEKSVEEESKKIFDVIGHDKSLAAFCGDGIPRLARIHFDEPTGDVMKGREDEHNMLVYYPGRLDFEAERHNDMEELVAPILFDNYKGKRNPSLDMENQIRMVRLNRFNRSLANRVAANRAIFMHNKTKEYIAFVKAVQSKNMKPSQMLAQKTPEEKLISSMQQLMKPDEIEELIDGRLKVQELIAKVQALQELQRSGVTEFNDEAQEQVERAIDNVRPKTLKRRRSSKQTARKSRNKKYAVWARIRKQYRH